MKRNYNTIIKALQLGIPIKAKTGHEISLKDYEGLGWDLRCRMSVLEGSLVEGQPVYTPKPDKFLPYPMDLGEFINWVDNMPEDEYTVICANVALNEIKGRKHEH